MAGLEEDFINTLDGSGLENLARDVGILKGSGIPILRNSITANAIDSLIDFSMSSPEHKVGNKRSNSSAPHSYEPEKKKPRKSTKKDEKSSERSTPASSGKHSKGLRHFSMKVCEKVEMKGRTTYNEVADELVEELKLLKDEDPDSSGKAYDEKNIRRRVYDALNVLMAMDIIAKVKKDIMWKGLPNGSSQAINQLKAEKEAKVNSIARKKEFLQELLNKQIALKNLIQRNSKEESKESKGNENKISLPFIIVNTKQDTEVKCEMGEDRTEILFKFSKQFQINDDHEVLEKMGLTKELPSDFPKHMIPYLSTDTNEVVVDEEEEEEEVEEEEEEYEDK